MKKIVNEKYKESYIEEVLDNGLKVIVWEKEGFEKSFAAMATPFGAYDLHQLVDGKEIHYHSGLAHFLEHKMFEDEHEDVMETFSKMGANVNAATSYHCTVYYFQTSGDLIEPLNLLLDFTQELKITEESVEKEKGIILQELNMYNQMSDVRLVRETFSSLYHENPLKYDVGGSDEDVLAVTLDELKACYGVNYHPSNMICVVVTGKDGISILEEIKKNQASKSFSAQKKIEKIEVNEPIHVVKDHCVFDMEVNQLKLNIAYKQKGIIDSLERCKHEMCLRFLFDAYFSTLNADYQTWLDEGIVNDFFGYEFDYGHDYGYIMVYGETDKKEEFMQLVSKQLSKIKEGQLSEELFVQCKRRYFGENIKELNDFESIAFNSIQYYFNGTTIFELYDILDRITLDDIQQAGNQLDLTHFTMIECQPKTI